MGILDLFKKGNKPNSATTDNGILGPTYLDGLTENFENPENLHAHEWRRKLKTTAGEKKFKIKFYGQLHQQCENLIVATDFAPPLIFAVDIITGQEILLFDGCIHGYNALFCDIFTDDQIKNRPITKYYKDIDENEIFEIVISTHYGVDYENELVEEVDENGLIELIDGTKIEFDKVKRNGYDTLQLWATNHNGKTFELVSEELA